MYLSIYINVKEFVVLGSTVGYRLVSRLDSLAITDTAWAELFQNILHLTSWIMHMLPENTFITGIVKERDSKLCVLIQNLRTLFNSKEIRPVMAPVHLLFTRWSRNLANSFGSAIIFLYTVRRCSWECLWLGLSILRRKKERLCNAPATTNYSQGLVLLLEGV